MKINPKKVAIIHFSALEFYPPTQNLLQVLEKEFSDIVVLSTHSERKTLQPFKTIAIIFFCLE